MSYRAIHKANEGFRFAVMWVLIAAFLLALPMMFVHPGMTIGLVWLGLIILAVATVVWRLMRGLEQSAVRRALRVHACPSCGAEVHRTAEDDDEWRCDACGESFHALPAQAAAH